jgi:hypothetical protein
MRREYASASKLNPETQREARFVHAPLRASSSEEP